MIPAVKHTFWARLAASHKEQRSPIMILVLSRYKEMQKDGLIKSFENIYLKACSISFCFCFCFFPQSTECLIPDLHPKVLSGVLKVSSCSASCFNPCRGKLQMPVCSCHHTCKYFSRKWLLPFKQNLDFSTISLFYVKFKVSYYKKKQH